MSKGGLQVMMQVSQKFNPRISKLQTGLEKTISQHDYNQLEELDKEIYQIQKQLDQKSLFIAIR